MCTSHNNDDNTLYLLIAHNNAHYSCRRQWQTCFLFLNSPALSRRDWQTRAHNSLGLSEGLILVIWWKNEFFLQIMQSNNSFIIPALLKFAPNNFSAFVQSTGFIYLFDQFRIQFYTECTLMDILIHTKE